MQSENEDTAASVIRQIGEIGHASALLNGIMFSELIRKGVLEKSEILSSLKDARRACRSDESTMKSMLGVVISTLEDTEPQVPPRP